MNKAAEKFRNLSATELKHQEREQMDQLFRLKFQMKMGQSESLNKIRELRRNVARLKTISRQHQLGIVTPKAAAEGRTAGTPAEAKPAVRAHKPAKDKAKAKPAAKAKTKTKTKTAKPSGKKK